MVKAIFIVRKSALPPINVALSTYWKPSLRHLYGADICTSQWLPLKIWTVQNGSQKKATEIGFDELTFLNCRFSERKIIKTERIAKILVSAIKQSLKARLPRLNEMTDFNKFISQSFNGRKFIAHCYEGEKPLLKDIVRKGEDALVLIGPEGDFSEEEVKKALKTVSSL